MVSTEVGPQTVVVTGLYVVHLVLSLSFISQEIFLSTFFDCLTLSFICDHDINQMQAIPVKEKGEKRFNPQSTKITSISAC